nr:DUF2249 domain-containing protein [Paraburkholderia sp. J7]
MADILDSRTYVFDARGIAKRFRHAAIFGALEALDDGETMRFVNDHDPVPLLQQIAQYYPRPVHIEYVARQPDQVVIDFVLASPDSNAVAAQQRAAGGCGSSGGTCGCSGG